MSDLGLPGGWATLGPALALPLPAELLTSAPVPANEADPDALAGVFRDLFDTLAAPPAEPRTSDTATDETAAPAAPLPAQLWRGNGRRLTADLAIEVEEQADTPPDASPRTPATESDDSDRAPEPAAVICADVPAPQPPVVRPMALPDAPDQGPVAVQADAQMPQIDLPAAAQPPAQQQERAAATAPKTPFAISREQIGPQPPRQPQMVAAGEEPVRAPSLPAASLHFDVGTDVGTERPVETPSRPSSAAKDAFVSRADACANAGSPGQAFEQGGETPNGRPDRHAIAPGRYLNLALAPKARSTAAVVADPAIAVKAMSASPLPLLMSAAALPLEAGVEVPVRSLAPRDVANQIVQSLRLAWSRGAAEAQIKLDPRQFGDLSVEMRLDGREVVVRLEADVPAVREWLRANQQTLTSALLERDLRLDRLDVRAPGEEPGDASHDGGDADRHEAGQHPRRQRRSGGREFALED